MLLILYLVKKRRISIKYSLVWLLPCFILIIFVLVPGFMDMISRFLGFKTASNMILTSLIGFLMMITIALTVIVSNQKDKIRLLIQEVSILKSEKK
jgi:hypothetical protein